MANQPKVQENRPKKGKLSRGKIVKYSILIVFIALLISISAITHKFGPYMGKVVDLETGTPLEGAAVLIHFRTDGFEGSGSYAGAIETVTDKNGEFKIKSQRVFVFHPFHKWNLNGYITIFKPGYGVYPDHDEVTPMFVPNGTMPETEYVIFKLPKLKTMEERRLNLPGGPPSGDVPERKVKNYLKLIDEERANIGLNP